MHVVYVFQSMHIVFSRTSRHNYPLSHHLLTCRGSIEGKGYRPSRASPDCLLVHGFSEEGTDGNMTKLNNMLTSLHRRHRNEAQEPAEAKEHQCLRIEHDFSLTCRPLKS
jgi:hypothetical protein